MKRKVNQDNCKVKRCRKCLVILTKENSKEYILKFDYLCIRCHQIESKKYEEKLKQYTRQNEINTYIDGKLIILKGNKRPHPLDNKCEICEEITFGTYKSHLQYHHWNDSDISKGIWCCDKCHKLLGAIEYNRHFYIEKALQLINQINNPTK